MFEEALAKMEIEYHRIQIATPRHNGKVERQHRIDELRFYRHLRMYSLEDGQKQLAVYQRESNNHIMTCLGMQSPNEILSKYHVVRLSRPSGSFCRIAVHHSLLSHHSQGQVVFASQISTFPLTVLFSSMCNLCLTLLQPQHSVFSVEVDTFR